MFKFTKSNIFPPEWVLLIIIPSTQFKIKKNDFEGTHLFITAVHYRMPTKLGEGNVFSPVCLFTGRVAPM